MTEQLNCFSTRNKLPTDWAFQGIQKDNLQRAKKYLQKFRNFDFLI